MERTGASLPVFIENSLPFLILKGQDSGMDPGRDVVVEV
jgi:hypothetical protein